MEEEIRKRIVEAGNKLVEKGLTYGSSGNISMRYGNKIF
ncbi:MAG TPA: class II aldolase/adducin family protein, partial [Thermoplasmatales archaeon]|nr:class II aldolase/adducin family protein [Thermoplasmatales archaeon]